MTQTLAEGLAGEGYSVTVVTTWFEGEPEVTDAENLKLIRLKSRRRFVYRSNPREMWSWVIHSKKFLSSYCKDIDFDLCLANFALPGGETALLLKKKFNIPFIVISHGHDIPWFFPKQMFWYHLLTYWRIKHICKQSEQLVLLSDFMKRNADCFTGKKEGHKNVIISNTYDEKLFYSDTTERNEVLTIIFSARLVEQKDPLTFLKAIKLLNEEQIMFKVWIFGDGPLRQKMENFIACNGLQHSVFMRGWVDKTELAEAYRRAHVFVSSSLQEGMSVAVLEAMAGGLYVMATPLGNQDKMVVEHINGNVFQKGDSKGLYELLKNYAITKHSSGYEISEETRKLYLGKYFHEEMINDYERLIGMVIKTR